jgi:hypothetical protein
MKSWNGLEDATATAPVKTRRIRLWWRGAWSATFIALVCLAAVDTIFPVKSWDPSFLKKEPALHDALFDWSQVRR